jgi:hypothetical protein
MVLGQGVLPPADARQPKKEVSGESRKPLGIGEVFLRLCHQGGTLFAGQADPFCRLALLQDAYVSSILVIHSFHIAETDALRVAVTQVTLENLPVYYIKVHGAERAHSNAGSASDALVIVHNNSSQILIPGESFHRADIHARCVLALLA